VLVEFWDRVSISEQERMFGRRKDTGAPLTGNAEFDTPAFATDPPATPSRWTRTSGWPIRARRPPTRSACCAGGSATTGRRQQRQLDMGLISAATSRTWTGSSSRATPAGATKPLVDYISPTGGGYFFALPGYAMSRIGTVAASWPDASPVCSDGVHRSARSAMTGRASLCNGSPNDREEVAVLVRAHRRALFAGTAAVATAAVRHRAARRPTSANTSPQHQGGGTTTPIKHLVVIFDENISFDHYFATYPKAANTDGTTFHASKHTPKANTLATPGCSRRTRTCTSRRGSSHEQAMTCDQNHSYGPEQKAANGGANDKYVENTSVDTCSGGLFGSRA